MPLSHTSDRRKCQLLSPDDLQIDWKPLYELAKIYLKRNSNKCVMHRFFRYVRELQRLYYTFYASYRYTQMG